MYKKLFPSVETIKQQNGDFFKELVKTVDKLKKDQSNIARWKEEQSTAISKVINKFTNGDVNIVFSEFECSFYPTGMDDLTNKCAEEGIELELDGAVDYNTGKLKGQFTNLKVTVTLARFLFIDKDFTTEEGCSMILHEVGHLVTISDLVARNYVANFALKEIVDKYTPESTIDERRHILTSVEKKLKLKTLDIDEISKVDDNRIVATLVLDKTQVDWKSITGVDYYDITAIEFLADQYTIKHGAGRHYVIAFGKLEKYGTSSQVWFYFAELVKLNLGIVSALILNPAWSLIYLSMWYFSEQYRVNSFKARYNTPNDRLTRLRLQIVSRLKDPNISKTARDLAREDLRAIDETIKLTKDNKKLMEMVSYIINPSVRQRFNAEKLHMELEKLAFNDLFIKAHDIKKIA